MSRNHLFRKGLTAGIISLFFATIIIPSSYADDSFTYFSDKENAIPASAENWSYSNFTLPNVHITYDRNKWKWGVVEFEDSNPEFDLNYSSFGTNPDWVNVGFNITIFCHTQAQVFPAWFEMDIELAPNGSIPQGMGGGGAILRRWNWTSQEHLAYFAITKDMVNTDVQGKIAVVGIPPRLFFLSYLFIPLHIFWWFADFRMIIPLEERRGATMEFTIHVHD